MPQRISIAARDYTPGFYQAEVQAPNRKSGAVLTLTREAPGWPDGDLFHYAIYERNRGETQANLIASASESGGSAVGRDGTPNPPLRVALSWSDDKDKDVIRFDITVIQTFRTAITLEFV